MGLRETINQKKSVSVSGAVLLFVVAGAFLAYTQWPERRPKGDKVFYTVDDGQTWFVDSIYKVPPFDYNGQTAVRAMVYSYENGHKKFCPYVSRFNSGTKKMLEDAIAQANRDGKPLSSLAIMNSPGTANGTEVKICGPGHQWISRGDFGAAIKVFDSAQVPDGSVVDLVMP